MNTTDILHEILKGMCPYMSCGVPTTYWKLAKKLTKEVYGPKGVKLLNSFHKTYDGAVDSRDEIILHSIDGWEDGGNTHIGPEELIEKLVAGNDGL